MLGGLLFVVCGAMRFHDHDPIHWSIGVIGIIGLCASFGAPALKRKKD
jgi:hypothetical protein